MDITHKPGTGPHVTKFNPSKRIKAAHRRESPRTPLRSFARACASPLASMQHPYTKPARAWLKAKGLI